jgi:hypothetical protein
MGGLVLALENQCPQPMLLFAVIIKVNSDAKIGIN